MNQCCCQFVHIKAAVITEMYELFFNLFQRKQIIHTAINTGNDRNLLLPFQKRTDNLHALTYQKVSVNICLKEEQILCRIIINTLIIKAVILVKIFCCLFICRNYQMRWKKPGKPIHKMSFLGLYTTTDFQNSMILFCLFFNFFDLCKTLQRLQNCFHTFPVFLLYSFMAASTLSVRISSTALHALSCASSTRTRSSLSNLPST